MALHPRPLIAVNGLLIEGENPYLKLGNRYCDAILKAGGIPIAIPPVGGPLDLERLLERVDGVLLTGGDDFDTARLGLGPTHPTATITPAAKQDFDFLLARAVVSMQLPVLGICYGMQLLGVAEGCGFYQHIPEDRPGAQNHSGGVVHSVRCEGGSRFSKLVREPELQVVSRHHQALASVTGPWSVAARDEQGLIEAIERAGHPYAFGVQWHPELSPEGSPHDRLFQGLIGAAAMRATRKLAGVS
jgi:putative glutamine amidotransferase